MTDKKSSKKIVLGIISVLLILVCIGLIVIGSLRHDNNYIEFFKASGENSIDSNYIIQEYNNETYYIMNNTYDNEDYSITSIYSHEYINNTYPELLTNGKVMTYNEYVEYCDTMKIKKAYNDNTKNYIVLSYGSENSWVDMKLVDIEYDTENKEITLYVYEDLNGFMGSGSGYVLAIPTEYTSDFKIKTVSCISKEWFETLSNPEKLEDYYRNMSMDKPVIYLYPSEAAEIEVAVTIDNGELTTTYPKYDNGWKVTAYPDGTLVDNTDREYNYLFWEGNVRTDWKIDEGFCIKGEDTLKFLEDKLTVLGLSHKEQADFISFWIPKMEHNNYNLIKFLDKEYTDLVNLETTRKFDSEIRVYMLWQASDVEVKIAEQYLHTPEREGSILVEWGGTELNSN